MKKKTAEVFKMNELLINNEARHNSKPSWEGASDKTK